MHVNNVHVERVEARNDSPSQKVFCLPYPTSFMSLAGSSGYNHCCLNNLRELMFFVVYTKNSFEIQNCFCLLLCLLNGAHLGVNIKLFFNSYPEELGCFEMV